MENNYFKLPQMPERPAVSASADYDIVIVGGGLAGLACGYELQSRGHKVCILEAARVGSGETSRSSAIITFAHDPIYFRLIKKHGTQTAAEFLRLQKLGAQKLEQIIMKNKIDCEYTRANYTMFAATEKGAKQIRQEKEAFKQLNEPFVSSLEPELPLNIIEQLAIGNQAHLNPAKFIAGLSKAFEKLGGKIYENSHVKSEPKENHVEVNSCSIGFKHLIIASHYPYINIMPGFYFLKLYQHRNCNIAFNNGIKLNNIYEGTDDEWYEFRPVKDGILCGGGAGRTGTGKYESRFKKMEKFLSEHLKVMPHHIMTRFAAQDVMTFDLMPFVGKYSVSWDNVYVITGFNKWGFTNSFAAAQIISDLIDGKISDSIFSPQRASMLMAPIKAAQNLSDVISGFAQLVFNTDRKKFENIGPGQGAIVKVKGHRVGAYRDDDGRLHCVLAACPHMGCALTWNKDELSWDCKCHGSRFDYDGRLLNGPALINLEKKDNV
ncbi:MAG: FAD-dependent oxidoreductase [Christensenellaceae bacterium]|nr:FAD-dependent oxidoreductase [Christensenellaceae bacterium]